MTKLGVRKEYDCQCEFCKNHLCVLESDEEGMIIGKCFHINCKNNK